MLFNGEQSNCAVKFSPFQTGRLALACAQNFGIVGNGSVVVIQAQELGLQRAAGFDTVDAALDIAWSEENENILASCSGDGSIKLWDLSSGQNPFRSISAHSKEVSGLDWNSNDTNLFLSCSWDDSVKLWSFADCACVRSFERHTYCVYSVKWNPQHANIFLSSSGDNTSMIWDTRQAAPSLVLKAHAKETLCGDWCKYNDCVLATCSIDKTIKTWDVRNPTTPLRLLQGHTYPVRKICFSPHVESLLLSCSYDMSVRLWDIAAPQDPQVRVWNHHQEFAVGIDWDVLNQGMIASCGWDACMYMWHQDKYP